MPVAEDDRVLTALREDFSFYAPTCLKILNTAGKIVPFDLKPAQVILEQAVRRQQAAGKPVRLIIPKARKEGVSTYAIGKIEQRTTQISNHNAICVAQDSDTAAEFLNMAEVMYANLPDSAEFAVKPPIANRQRKKEIVYGNPARAARAAGDLGLNSRLKVDTANEFEAGRGFTYHTVHCSEVAFWADAKRKLTALLNAVPDEPTTMVLLESTSNGYNHWRTLCYQAQNGESDFELIFLPWYAEPQYVRGFVGEQEREEFIATIGSAPYGADEPDLIEFHGCTPEQLNWRRWAIANRCQGDLRVFRQEYPATLDESFGSTGTGIFNPSHVAAARRIIEAEPLPTLGRLSSQAVRSYPSTFGTVNVPQEPLWTPDPAGMWRLWADPADIAEEAQFIVTLDPAGDEVMVADDAAMHAAQIIDHRTGKQVGELEMQGDPDLVAEQIFLAALLFNQARIAVEVTGGYGLSINRRIHTDWKYPFVYRRRSTDSTRADQDVQHRFGWDTNRATRQLLIDGAIELLREGTHGIRSLALIHQFSTFVRDKSGKPVPAPDERSDLLMAWMIAQQIRQAEPVKRSVSESRVVSTSTHRARYSSTKW